MLSRKKTTWLSLGIFIFTLISIPTVAKAQAPLKDWVAVELSKRKWKVIDGFRSAKFGMSEKQVVRAIGKDFEVQKTKITHLTNPVEKTTILEITRPKLLPFGGPAKIGYIFGYKSKKLAAVNIFWGKGVTETVDAQGIVNVANFLKDHFVKKRYRRDKLIIYNQISASKTIIFQGFDQKNRGVLLVLTTTGTEQGQVPEKRRQEYMLKLQYFPTVKELDFFRPKIK